jgi:hypothetical protein
MTVSVGFNGVISLLLAIHTKRHLAFDLGGLESR